MSRSALLLGCTALLTTSAAPPPLPKAVPPAAAAQDRHSPVRCVKQAPIYTSGTVVQRGRGPVSAPVPMPPPMPTYAPLPSPPPSSAGVVMQEFRAAPAAKVATPSYGTPGNTERYDGRAVAAIQSVTDQPVSTFSVDVDTGAYANVRRFLNQGQDVPAEAVRTEEMINYFRYDYPRPASRDVPFSVTTDVSTTPWNAETRLLRIGLRGYDVDAKGRPPANLVFLVDVSGSMESQDKLPLVKKALTQLADRLTPRDRVSIVVYAGAAGMVLEPTNKKEYVKAALDCLSAGGSTAGGDGIKLAYSVARATFVQGGINRIFLATDGDFNVGINDKSALEALVKKNRDDGITLTTLGFGTGNYNEAMMERIADVGNGNYAYIDSAMEATKVLDDELSATLFTIAKDVKVQVEFNPAQVKQYRLIGYENRALAEEDFNNDTVDAGDIGAGHQVTALYEVVPAGANGWTSERRYDANRTAAPAGKGDEMAFVKLRYKLPGNETSKLIERPVSASLMRSAAAPRGDMAFVTSVAAFGQHLRGDKYLNGYSYIQIGALAPASQNYWRSEFARLVKLADSGQPAGSSSD
ncbi:Ca-activated chloride channel family protein [Sphingomonas kyeonggiensis]|uniref:vWA domain-containing protein n=1 Tax=Sphingomonas kyeonggiensis TaxID=1268553 RepID=UPI00278865F5|nr:VWA domain-containing protein [Sphingomonas kyeonggiensis]MDQ0248162.1 Ca-activated chloride channel family protein [Sphingomonas kyeonggiensis]